MYSKSDNIEIMIDNETVQVIQELFEFCFTKISKRLRRISVSSRY